MPYNFCSGAALSGNVETTFVSNVYALHDSEKGNIYFVIVVLFICAPMIDSTFFCRIVFKRFMKETSNLSNFGQLTNSEDFLTSKNPEKINKRCFL